MSIVERALQKAQAKAKASPTSPTSPAPAGEVARSAGEGSSPLPLAGEVARSAGEGGASGFGNGCERSPPSARNQPSLVHSIGSSSV